MFDTRPYLGKELIHVSDQLQKACDQAHLLFAVMDPDAPANGDVEDNRLLVYVDEEFGHSEDQDRLTGWCELPSLEAETTSAPAVPG